MLNKTIKKFIANSPCSCNGSHHNGSPSQCINPDTEEVTQQGRNHRVR